MTMNLKTSSNWSEIHGSAVEVIINQPSEKNDDEKTESKKCARYFLPNFRVRNRTF